MIESPLLGAGDLILQGAAFNDQVELGILLFVAFLFIALSYLFSRVGLDYAED